MKYLVSTKNHVLKVHDLDAENSRTILAIPGLGLSSDMFLDCFAELRANWDGEPLRFIGINRPGLDAPPCRCPSPHGLTEVALMHLRAADAIGIEHFDLVGHSLGGPVVLKIAELAPDRVRTIFIIDGAVYGAFLPSSSDGDLNAGVMRIDSERFAEEFGALRHTYHPTGIAIKGEKSWPNLPDDPFGGWRTFSRVWRRSYKQIIAPYLGAVLIQTSLGHWMHSSRPESVGQGRYLHGNPWAVAQFHAGILKATDRADKRIKIPHAALESAGAHIAYDPFAEPPTTQPPQTLAALRKFRGVYLPTPRPAVSAEAAAA